MLFFFAWKDDADGNGLASLLVDERDEKRARAIATQHHGTPPAAFREMPPGVFAAEVFFTPIETFDADELEDLSDEDVQAGDVVVAELLPHVETVLRLYEDQCSPDSDSVPAPLCGSEGRADDGRIVLCELEEHDEEEAHVGGGMTW